MSGMLGIDGNMKSGIAGENRVPAWNAGTTSSYGHSGNNKIEFNNLTATGKFSYPAGSYNTSSDVYVAPTDGYYFVYTQVLWEGVSNNAAMHDSINIRCENSPRSIGARRAYYVNSYTGTGAYFGDWTSCVIYATIGGEFSVTGHKNETVHGNTDYTFFCGHLIR